MKWFGASVRGCLISMKHDPSISSYRHSYRCQTNTGGILNHIRLPQGQEFRDQRNLDINHSSERRQRHLTTASNHYKIDGSM